MDLESKTVVVTGAARGIGLGIAKAFARTGANLVLGDLGARGVASSEDWAYRLASSEELAAAVKDVEAEAAGGAAVGVEVDVSDAASAEALVAKALEAFGSLDVLVNNAGVIASGAIVDYDETSWDRTFAVNVKGIFLMCRAAIPALIDGGGGAIINIASIAGKRGYAGLGAYCASKFAALGLTQSLAQELAVSRVRVNAICPGVLATSMWTDHLSRSEMLQTMVAAEPGAEAYETFVNQAIPLGRDQTPADIGEAAVYLATADNVTGIAVNVAGGQEMN